MFDTRTPAALALIVALLVGTAACAGGAGDPAESDPSLAASHPSTDPSAAPAAGAAFGPTGYHGIRLGMTLAQATAAGATRVETRAGGCAVLRSKGSAAPPNAGDVVMSPSGRVSDISAFGASAVTPEGIHVGSSQADVLKAWPQAEQTPDFWVAPVPGNRQAQYLFGFDQHGTLGGLVLTTVPREDCAN